jgi:hypothetical protein
MSTQQPTIQPAAPQFVAPPAVPPAVPPADPTPPAAPPADPVPPEDECPPEPCEPILVPMNLEIKPDITLCIDKPKITLKNNAVCICTPCKK